MDVCMKKGFQFSRFTGFLLPAGNELHYIGGAEVLPAPLSPEEEALRSRGSRTRRIRKPGPP